RKYNKKMKRKKSTTKQWDKNIEEEIQIIKTSSFSELMQAKNAIEELKMEKPDVYKKFAHIIHLTYQLQFKFQYMGSLIMDEDSTKHCPKVQDDYVLNVY